MTEKKKVTHEQRMQKKKEVVDAAIDRAEEERGILLVLTGNGKGKSSSAFGMVARALGHEQKVAVVQFIKGAQSTGEDLFFQKIPEVDFHVMGEGFTWETQDKSRDIEKAREAWEIVKQKLADPTTDLLVLDELNIVLRLKYLPVEEVCEALANKPRNQSVVVTGRGAPKELIEIADTVTDVTLIKHAFQAGIKARKGVEF